METVILFKFLFQIIKTGYPNTNFNERNLMRFLAMFGLSLLISPAIPFGVHTALANNDNYVSRCTQFEGHEAPRELQSICIAYSEWQIRHTDLYGHELVGVSLVDSTGNEVTLRITKHEQVRPYCNRYGICSIGYMSIEAYGGGFTATFQIGDEFNASPPYAVQISSLSSYF